LGFGVERREEEKKITPFIVKTNEQVDWFLYSAVHASILIYQYNLSRLHLQAPNCSTRINFEFEQMKKQRRKTKMQAHNKPVTKKDTKASNSRKKQS
jgi:hypothetical protein